MSESGHYIGAIDQGTSSTKLMLFDRAGAVAGHASAAHESTTPERGWSEQDPREIWENTKTVIREALTDAGIEPWQLAGLGITNQRETTVVWDSDTGEPVYDAIVWQDQRPADRMDQLEADGWTDYVRERTGLEPDPYLSAGKLEWILDHQDLRAEARNGDVLFGTIDSWLLHKLTGSHATDVTNASHTMLFDIHELTWDDELLAEFDIPAAMLPEVRPSSDSDYHGTTDPDGVFGREVPVAGMIGDQQSALVGQTGFDNGDVKYTMGTSSVMIKNIGTAPGATPPGLNTTIGYQLSGQAPIYAHEGMTWAGGQAIDWLVDMNVVDSAAETEAMARSVDATDSVYFVPAFNGLGTPFWRPDATGTIVGLTLGTGPEELARATLEAIAFRANDVIDAANAVDGPDVTRIRIDGGISNNEFICQFLADVTGLTVERPVVNETTAFGAAVMAGLAVDFWPDLDAVRDCHEVDAEYVPGAASEAARERYSEWRTAVEKSYE